jgi:UDP-N-acetylmuramoyl-L-alanyl-D-glutamate--2,6-diaminopimelate ligase
MRLQDLIRNMPGKKVVGNPDVDIQNIAYHSARVDRGMLFVCVSGLHADGHAFIEEALDRGAAALVVEQKEAKQSGVPVIRVPDSRMALAYLSAAFFGHPSREMRVIGVTGTNGKTTTTYLIESILKNQSLACGVIGTINYRYDGYSTPAPMTTPESYETQRLLNEMKNAGVTHVVIEVSSHALDLKRVHGCHFDVGVFTNLSQDHLDYHTDLNDYRRCKEHLFTQILPQGDKKPVAIVNVDDPTGQVLSRVVTYPKLTYAIHTRASIRADKIRTSLRGVTATIHRSDGSMRIRSPLVGEFNIYNILAAMGVAMALEIPGESVREAVENLSSVPGRMERIENDRGIEIFVDYAHTPDALERALTVLKSLRNEGRLMTLFGCGGDRDRTKRPLMGQAVARLSDLAIVTSDNPRSESPRDILRDIETGLVSEATRRIKKEDFSQAEPRGYLTVENRREAIDLVIRGARSGDIILIAGKGHESYQILGNRKVPFDDRDEVRKALAKSPRHG